MHRAIDHDLPHADSGLAGRHALVTGAARGIGLGAARSLAALGASVTLVDRDHDAVQQVAAALGAALVGSGEGPRATLGLTADVANEDEVGAAVRRATDGLGPVDVLVCAAGIRGAGERVADLSLASWNARLAVNLTGAFLFARAVVGTMCERGWGRIVLVSSQLATRGSAGRADYCASKAGLHGLARSLAREVAASGVTVNVVAPGPVQTSMLSENVPEALEALRADIPLGRFATVEEVVPAILLLASAQGAYFTGSIVDVSGGHAM